MRRITSWRGTFPTLGRGNKPDPDVRRLMVQLGVVGLADMSRVSVQTVRRQWQLCVKAFATRDAGVTVASDEIVVGTHRIGVRVYRAAVAELKSRPILVWYHGGGFVFGDLYTAGATCRALARRTGAIVVAVDYRLAPEHSLDEAMSDCLAAFHWAAKNATALGGDPTKLAVGGDSAGGTLAALVSHETAGHEIAPVLQLLVYPACDLSRDHSHSPDAVAPLTGAHVDWLRKRIGKVSDLDDPRFSPVKRVVGAGMPMTIMLTAGFDPLRDEAAEYAKRLAAADVPLRLLHYPGQFHGFLSFDRVLAGGKDAFDRMSRVFKSALLTDSLSEGLDEVVVPHVRALRSTISALGPVQRLREGVVVCLLMSELLLGRGRS